MTSTDLTVKARAVLAGLSSTMRHEIREARPFPGDAATIVVRCRRAANGTNRALRCRGLIKKAAGYEPTQWCLTDLGREVARLLAEGGAP